MPNFVITDTTSAEQTLTDGQFGFITATGTLVQDTFFGLFGITVSGDVSVVIEGDVLRTNATIATALSGTEVTFLDLALGSEADLTTMVGDALYLKNMGSLLLQNQGSIVALDNFTAPATPLEGDAVHLEAAASSGYYRIDNGGVIAGHDDGIDILDAISIQIVNTGEIRGRQGSAIDVETSGLTNFALVNTGVLATGSINAVQVTGATATIRNAGTIVGDILLGGGNDSYRGSTGVLLGAISAGVGNDLLILGDGAEQASGDTGNDRLSGNGGTDTLFGGDGSDDLAGGDGADVLSGGIGNDALSGGAGDDVTDGGDGDDVVRGNDGADTLAGVAGHDLLIGGAGADTAYGGDGNDQLSGNGEGDALDGGTGDDVILGGDGDDLMLAGIGNDVLYGGAGGDDIGGDAGDDLIQGGGDDDGLVGGAGNDMLLGGAGDDEAAGGAGNDTLLGGSGDDSLVGGAGLDWLTGGSGADLFDFDVASDSTAQASDRILDFTRGEDTVDLTDLTAQTMVFRGTAAFAGGGQASVRYQVSASGDANVFVDRDGNGTSDMRFVLFGVAAVTESDFLF